MARGHGKSDPERIDRADALLEASEGVRSAVGQIRAGDGQDLSRRTGRTTGRRSRPVTSFCATAGWPKRTLFRRATSFNWQLPPLCSVGNASGGKSANISGS